MPKLYVDGAATVSILVVLLAATGCVSRLADEANAGPARQAGAERASHLLTPEGIDDLSKLDDGVLQARAAKQQADAEARTAATFRYAVDYQGNDLSSDSAYRKLLYDMKQSETELDRLERELESRRERRAPRTPTSVPLP